MKTKDLALLGVLGLGAFFILSKKSQTSTGLDSIMTGLGQVSSLGQNVASAPFVLAGQTAQAVQSIPETVSNAVGSFSSSLSAGASVLFNNPKTVVTKAPAAVAPTVTTYPTSSTAYSTTYGTATVYKIPTLPSISPTSIWGQIASNNPLSLKKK